MDNITDAANIGGIFRSAAALGVDAVLVMRSCCDPLCRKAVRVSMGTVFQIPWTYIENNVKELGEWGFKTAAMALCEHAVSIDDQALMAEGLSKKDAVKQAAKETGTARNALYDLVLQTL